MLDIDIAKERILKEYIDGSTIYDLVKIIGGLSTGLRHKNLLIILSSISYMR